MAFLLTAIEVPVPVGPLTAPSIDGCDNTTTTAPTFAALTQFGALNAVDLNKLFCKVFSGGAFGGLGYCVVNGLTIGVVGGLQVSVAAGAAMIGQQVEIATSTVIALTDEARSTIWLHNNGTLEAVADDLTPPDANCLFLGTVDCTGGAAGTADYSGVCYFKGGSISRTVADRGAPADTPGSGVTFLTETAAGAYGWSGGGYEPVGTPVSAVTLTGTYALDANDAPVQSLDPGAAARIVTLPASPVSGDRLVIRNADAVGGFNITVKDSGGTIVLATLMPGDAQEFVALAGGNDTDPVYELVNPLNAYAIYTLTGSLTLSYLSPYMHRVSCASAQHVILPSAATVAYAKKFLIFNDNAGGGANVLVRNSADSSTVATLTPGQYVEVPAINSGGSPAWPTSVTPASSPA